MKRIIGLIVLIVSGLLVMLETVLLFQAQHAGPLDANLSVTGVYFLTVVMFVVSLYHTLSLRKGLRK